MLGMLGYTVKWEISVSFWALDCKRHTKHRDLELRV